MVQWYCGEIDGAPAIRWPRWKLPRLVVADLPEFAALVRGCEETSASPLDVRLDFYDEQRALEYVTLDTEAFRSPECATTQCRADELRTRAEFVVALRVAVEMKNSDAALALDLPPDFRSDG